MDKIFLNIEDTEADCKKGSNNKNKKKRLCKETLLRGNSNDLVLSGIVTSVTPNVQ